MQKIYYPLREAEFRVWQFDFISVTVHGTRTAAAKTLTCLMARRLSRSNKENFQHG